MKIFKNLFFLLFLTLLFGCKTSSDFVVVKSVYQPWYDGRGTTSGINFHFTLKATKKIKKLHFNKVYINGKEARPVAVINKNRIDEIKILNKNDTVSVGAPLLLKGRKPIVPDTTVVTIFYNKNGKEKKNHYP